MSRGVEYCNSSLKRSLDILVASGGLSASSPLWIAMCLYNKSRNQPLLFHQERLGMNQKSFMVIKFETLYNGAEKKDYQNQAMHLPSLDKEANDPRVANRAMAFMRRSGLNEIPQLINVLKGEMSIVGPRPLPTYVINVAADMFPDLVREWTEIALQVKPGLVGTSPLTTRSLPVEQFDKVALTDMKYVESASFFGDLSIIAQAILATTK